MNGNQQHVVNAEGGMSLSEILNSYMDSDPQTESRESFRRQLLSFSVTEIVKELDGFIISNDSTQRRESVALLAWMTGFRADIEDAQVPHLVLFFCSRLSDWSSVEPSIQGIKELYTKHIGESIRSLHPAEDDTIIERDRADLSLMLGHASVSDLPPYTGSTTERVLTKLLINVHAPSFGRQVRLEVLSLFKIFISRFHHELSALSETLIKGLSIEGEDERDPVCLSIFLECIDLLFETGIVSSEEMTRSTDELFDTLKSYFPIGAIGDVELSNLTALMKRCLVRFGLRSIEFLCPQLDDVSRAEAAFTALHEIGKQRPAELLPFLLNEWTISSQSPLLGRLWQTTIEAADSEYSDALIVRLIEKGEKDLLIVTANTSSHMSSRVLSLMPNEDALISLIPRIDYSAYREALKTTVSVDDVLERLLTSNSLTECIGFVARVVPSISRDDLAVFLTKTLMSMPLSSADVQLAIERLFESFPAVALKSVDTLDLVKRLMAIESTVVGTIVSSVFEDDPSGVTLDQLHNILGNKWYLSVKIFETNADFVNLVLDRPSITAELPAVVIAAMVNSFPPDSYKAVSLVHATVIEKGRVDVLAHISDPAVVRSVIGAQDKRMYLDLLSAIIAVPDEAIAMCAIIPVVQSIDSILVQDVLDLLKHCPKDSVWTSAILAYAGEKSENILSQISSQLTPGRVQLLINTTNGSKLILPLYQHIMMDPHKAVSPLVIAHMLTSPSMDCMHSFVPQPVLERLILEALQENDTVGHKLAIKYIVSNPNLTVQFIDQLITVLCDHMRDQSSDVLVRFSCAQSLAVMTEMVPPGKLGSFKPLVTKTHNSVLKTENKQVVRKQIALSVTSWLAVEE